MRHPNPITLTCIRSRSHALRPALLTAALLLVCTGPAHAYSGIKRWVDEHGIVHYSDTVPQAPARAGLTVQDVHPQPAVVTDEQTRAQAQARLQAYRQSMAEPAADTPAPVASASAPASAPVAAASAQLPHPADQSCRAQWQRYDAAYACLNGHRAQGGIVAPDALQKCPVLQQPDCPMPADMVAR